MDYNHSSRRFRPWGSRVMALLIKCEIILWLLHQFSNICKPEEGWYGQPKYCYKKTIHVVLNQLCCSLRTSRSHFISRLSMTDRVNVVLRRTVVVDRDLRFDNLCGSHLQSQGEVWYWIDMAASLPQINLPLTTIRKIMGIFSLCDPTPYISYR